MTKSVLFYPTEALHERLPVRSEAAEWPPAVRELVEDRRLRLGDIPSVLQNCRMGS